MKERINDRKIKLFENINKIDKPLVRHSKNKKREEENY